jgi:uncharacterized membrane protein
MKHLLVNEKVDQVNVVLNAVVMEEFMLKQNVIHVDVKTEQLGRIIQEIVHVMAMLGKHRMSNVMIVMDVVINKNNKRQTNTFLFFPFSFFRIKEENKIN